MGAYASHPVSVVNAGTRLAAVLGRTEVDSVPTYHHQGVDVLGTGLQPTAWAPDGTLEAIEDPELASLHSACSGTRRRVTTPPCSTR